MADVTIFETAPRDGLQNAPREASVAERVALVDALSACGLTRIEAASFVSPRWVPKMAGAAAVMGGIARAPGVRYAALTPNLRGFEGAREARTDEVAIFASASEGFSKANLNCTIAESLERFAPVAQAAREAAIPLRGYVSVVTRCPYDGPTPPGEVARVTEALLGLGCFEVSLGETLGRDGPDEIAPMLDEVLGVAPPSQLAAHWHDTEGHAVASARLAYERGIRVFDASAGGIGGCPYAPGAKGNVDTRDLVDAFEADGIATGVDRAALEAASRLAREVVGLNDQRTVHRDTDAYDP